MPQFNVGDRVRRICPYGGDDEIPLNTPLTITEIRENNNLVYVEGYQGGLYRHRFELVEAAPIDNREEITIYTLIYTHPVQPGKGIITYLNEDTAMEQANLMGQESNRYTLLAMKKFKTRI